MESNALAARRENSARKSSGSRRLSLPMLATGELAEKFQGGGHANASGAMLPKSIRNIPEAVEYLRQVGAQRALRAHKTGVELIERAG